MKSNKYFAFMSRSFWKVLICICFSLIMGCNSKTDNKGSDVVLESYRLIDEQRTDEAIQLLESTLIKSPDRSELKVILASAYAHKAGIKIQSFIPLLIIADKQGKKAAVLDKTKLKEDRSITDEVNKNAQNVSELLVRFAGFFSVYLAIPVVNQAEATYLKHALNILTDPSFDAKDEDIVYRLVLKIIYFKYLLIEELFSQFVPTNSNEEEGLCTLDISTTKEVILTAGQLLVSIHDDISKLSPDSKLEATVIRDQILTSMNALAADKTTLINLDEVANLLLQKDLMHIGFGKIIKCGGN